MDFENRNVSYKDKILPTQPYYSSLYAEKRDIIEAIDEMCASYSTTYELNAFKLDRPESIDIETMSTPPAQAAFISFLISATNAKRILEIGTFIGKTAMHFANAAPSDGEIVTIEIGEEFAQIAKKNFAQNNFQNKVTLIHADATSAISKLAQNFNMIYIDGAKQSYLDFAIQCEALLADDGIIVVDDVFFHGDALMKNPSTEKGLGCKKLLHHYAKSSHMMATLLPVFNGMLILQKQKDSAS